MALIVHVTMTLLLNHPPSPLVPETSTLIVGGPSAPAHGTTTSAANAANTSTRLIEPPSAPEPRAPGTTRSRARARRPQARPAGGEPVLVGKTRPAALDELEGRVTRRRVRDHAHRDARLAPGRRRATRGSRHRLGHSSDARRRRATDGLARRDHDRCGPRHRPRGRARGDRAAVGERRRVRHERGPRPRIGRRLPRRSAYEGSRGPGGPSHHRPTPQQRSGSLGHAPSPEPPLRPRTLVRLRPLFKRRSGGFQETGGSPAGPALGRRAPIRVVHIAICLANWLA